MRPWGAIHSGGRMKKPDHTRTATRSKTITRRGLLKTLAAVAGITATTGLPRISPAAPGGGVEARFYKRGDHLAG